MLKFRMNKLLETKKLMVLNFIQLGMDIDSAYILTELTKEEISDLDNDEEFKKELVITQYTLEKDLLEKFKTGVENAVLKGNTKPIEWMLSKINTTRWGDNEKELPVRGTLVITKDDKELL